MGVRELGGGLGLPGESLPDILLKGELGGQHLDGHPALEPLVTGAVHHAHPAPPDLAFDRIRVSQGFCETGREAASCLNPSSAPEPWVQWIHNSGMANRYLCSMGERQPKRWMGGGNEGWLGRRPSAAGKHSDAPARPSGPNWQ